MTAQAPPAADAPAAAAARPPAPGRPAAPHTTTASSTDAGQGNARAVDPAATAHCPRRSAELARILRILVPVIVRLAQRKMNVGTIRALSVGAILEFEKSVEEELELLVNNRCIGHGTCVRVGENFGLRLNRVGDRGERVRSLGRTSD